MNILPPDLLPPPGISPADARALQEALRARVVLTPPPDFQPKLVAGLDISTNRGSDRAYAGVVVLDADTLETVAEASAIVELTFPYIPGLLSFRELPALEAAWEKLDVRPDLLVFDGQGIAHPRHFGIACHGGLLFDLPSIGCAKSILVGKHEPLGEERGATAPLVHRGEVVGVALRTRDRVNPVYVSPGYRMDLATAVEWVLRLAPRYREPETTRRSHRLVNELRRADMTA
jgi:deoxyribonuclease V